MAISQQIIILGVFFKKRKQPHKPNKFDMALNEWYTRFFLNKALIVQYSTLLRIRKTLFMIRIIFVLIMIKNTVYL